MSGGIDKLFRDFSSLVVDTRSWLGATEILWRTAPRGSEVRRTLGPDQLEALHEAAFARIFGAWETFQEEILLRFLCGQGTATYAPIRASGISRPSSIENARLAVLHGRRFLLWHSPSDVVTRANGYVLGSPLEVVLNTNQDRIQHFSNVRHRIAHSSEDAKRQFMASATALTGTSHDGVAGRLLRSVDLGDGLTMRMWIHVISEDLVAFAKAMTE